MSDKTTVQMTLDGASNDPQSGHENTRALDPNVLQRKASDPNKSVWVSASAGTGKTKVLTDRVLRLLLPRRDGAPGTPPHKIMGLTFTKAAANEMALRINKMLGQWAVLPLTAEEGKEGDQKNLTTSLRDLLGCDPTAQDIEAARRLFAEIVDTPGGLQIMTLHSFCQSILSRFPLEAGLPPYFSLIDERQAALYLLKAQDFILEQSQMAQGSGRGSPLHKALERLSSHINEDQFSTLIRALISERYQIETLLQASFGTEGLYTKTCATLGIIAGQEPEDILLEALQNEAFDQSGLLNICRALENSQTKMDQKAFQALDIFLSSAPEKRVSLFDTYAQIFLKQDGARRKSFISAKAKKNSPEALDIMETECARILKLQDHMNAAQSALLTRDLFVLGKAVLDRYQTLKAQEGLLDFDDLIFKTEELFSKNDMASWVLYKLDQGLDHILIDEAQDTNPEQWRIIDALCTEFYAGEGAQDTNRTIFTVGDEKQSIYSFQRASPEEFARMKLYFEQKIKEAGKAWEPVYLNISFRSSKAVLDLVDGVFANPLLRQGLSQSEIKHISFREGQGGLVELWPLYETQKKEPLPHWAPPVEIIEGQNAQAQLAQDLAQKIKYWLKTKEMLPAYGRAIKPSDIMILVRTRTAFVTHLARALKAQNIPVSGLDRMVLGEQIAVQDLQALAQFALLPEDDLNLACLLKSPLVGLSEEDLYQLAYNRSGSLWESLKAAQTHEALALYLKDIIKEAQSKRPYDFFNGALQKPCPADSVSGLRAFQTRLSAETLDPINEFLSVALNFEKDHIPSLQGFLHGQAQEQSDIKRQIEEGADQVRIMTVHGSKGLQAPIVILPDTMRTTKQSPAQADRRLIWPDKSGLDVPLWSPRKKMAYELYQKGLNVIDERQEEEYRRLLYVAMTRAEDRLYIAGYKKLKEPLAESWYYFIKEALENHEHCETLPDGGLRLSCPQIKAPDRQKTHLENREEHAPMPSWLFEHVEREEESTSFNPSQPQNEEEPPVISPLQKKDNYRFLRGNLTHKLLETLPCLAHENRLKAAQDYIEHYGQDLPEKMRDAVVQEVMLILEDEQFAPIFGAGSMAEVPLTGHLSDGRMINGQIDRLLVTPEDIFIVDYKTNRPPPQDVKDVPLIYVQQMQAYAQALTKIYPDRRVHCALLWTDQARLMPLEVKTQDLTQREMHHIS